MPAIDINRVPSFAQNYIRQVEKDDLREAFSFYPPALTAFLQDIPEDKWGHRYAEGKWTIAELVLHIIDAERIFSYRALRIARQDQTPLPGFEENDYVLHSKASSRTKESLINELKAVQQSTRLLFESFDEEQLECSGTASGASTYVRGIGFTLIGHGIHHLNILRERYLK
jgi:uncharacterized damage-inducible protein DinB